MATYSQKAKEARLKVLECLTRPFMLEWFYATRNKAQSGTKALYSMFSKIRTEDRTPKVLFFKVQKQKYLLGKSGQEEQLVEVVERKEGDRRPTLSQKTISKEKALSDIQGEDEQVNEGNISESKDTGHIKIWWRMFLLWGKTYRVFINRPHKRRWNATQKVYQNQHFLLVEKRKVPKGLPGSVSQLQLI